MFLTDGYVALRDLLPREDFYRQGADLSYAPAGVLAGGLLDAAGPDALARTYLELSGSPDHLSSLTADHVAAELGVPLGLPGTDAEALAAGLGDHLATLRGNPLRAAPATGVAPDDSGWRLRRPLGNAPIRAPKAACIVTLQ